MSTNLTIRHQQAIRSQLNYLAWLLDNSITIPFINYRIGLEAIIGLIPVVGDIAGMLISSYIVTQAMRLGISRAVVARMVGNILLEGVIGAIPLIGDLFDATFKANLRNVRLLNQALAKTTANA